MAGGTEHVYRYPHENAYVVPQKLDERVFLFRIQSGSNENRLLGIVVDQLEFFVLLGLDVLP